MKLVSDMGGFPRTGVPIIVDRAGYPVNRDAPLLFPRSDINLIATGGETRIAFAYAPYGGVATVYKNGVPLGPRDCVISGRAGVFAIALSALDIIDVSYCTAETSLPAASTLTGNRLFAMWNPADSSANETLTNGNLTATDSNNSTWSACRSTLSKTSGKWYVEFTLTALTTSGTTVSGGVGFGDASMALGNYLGSDVHGFSEFLHDGGGTTNKYNNGSGAALSFGSQSAGANGKLAIDVDAGKLWFGLVGTGWNGSGDPVTGASPDYTFTAGTAMYVACSNIHQSSITLNSGGSAFGDAVPAGFSAGFYADS